jgi:hypothetical protein
LKLIIVAIFLTTEGTLLVEIYAHAGDLVIGLDIVLIINFQECKVTDLFEEKSKNWDSNDRTRRLSSGIDMGEKLLWQIWI